MLSMPYTLGEHLAFYEALGFNVIPIQPARIGNKETGKQPILLTGDFLAWRTYQQRMSTHAERRFWWPETELRIPQGHPGVQNVGIVTGQISNLIVLDLDDEETYSHFTEQIPELFDHFTVKTGRGFHIYMRPESPSPIGTVSFDWNDKRHHVKAEGGYVVAPPSMHYSGTPYCLMSDSEALDARSYQAPTLRTVDHADIARKLIEAGAEIADSAEGVAREPGWVGEILSRLTTKGERQDTLIRLAGHLAHVFGEYRQAEAMAWLQLWNDTRCHPRLTQRELDAALDGCFRRERRKPVP